VRTSILSAVVGSWCLASTGHADVQAIDEARLVSAIQASDARIARLDAEVAAARARGVAAGVRPNPSVSIDREVPYVDGHGLATDYLRLTVPIDVSGRRGLAIDAADSDVRAQESEAASETFLVVIDGLRAFDDAAYARLRLDMLSGERASLVRAADIVRQRGKAGDVAGYDVQRIELELAGYDDQIASAQIELSRARKRLAALVGQPDGEVDAASTLELPVAPPPIDALLAGVVERRADHRAAKLRIDAAQQRLRAADRSWVPLPSFNVGAISADLGDRTGTGYVAGLSLTIPVFDHGQAERAQAAADRRLGEADARWIATQARAQVQSAYATLTARTAQARAFATAQSERLDAMLHAAETAFREGNASIVELLDAHRAARDVRLRGLELRRDVIFARLDLELALGRRL
jgi:cobalt-zinc-cadmium efflux system outer membrane protein